MADKAIIESWLSDSDVLLVGLEQYKTKSMPHYIVFDLQQAEEKIAKSTLACIHLVSMSKPPPMLDLIDTLLGLKDTEPEDYGHNWHKEFLRRIDNIYNSPILKMLPLNQDINTKIQAAKNVQSIPNPTLSEVEGLIRGCNMLLDIASNDEDMMQKFNAISGGLSVNLGALTDNVASISSMDKNSSLKFILKRLRISIVIITLAILDVILEPHFDARYYPKTKSQVVIDDNFSLVVKYPDLRDLLKRCIDIDRNYISS